MAAKLLRRCRGDLLRPVPDTPAGEVQVRDLSSYDQVLGLEPAAEPDRGTGHGIGRESGVG